MAKPPPAKPEFMHALGIVGYFLAIETIGFLARSGRITGREGAAIIDAALREAEEKAGETPHAAFETARELLGAHLAMWFPDRPSG